MQKITNVAHSEHYGIDFNRISLALLDDSASRIDGDPSKREFKQRLKGWERYLETVLMIEPPILYRTPSDWIRKTLIEAGFDEDRWRNEQEILDQTGAICPEYVEETYSHLLNSALEQKREALLKPYREFFGETLLNASIKSRWEHSDIDTLVALLPYLKNNFYADPSNWEMFGPSYKLMLYFSPRGSLKGRMFYFESSGVVVRDSSALHFSELKAQYLKNRLQDTLTTVEESLKRVATQPFSEASPLDPSKMPFKLLGFLIEWCNDRGMNIPLLEKK